VKREDFVIDAIPPGYEVWDIDLAPDGQIAFVLASPSDQSAQALLIFDNEAVPVPEEAIFRRDRPPHVVPPAVRCAGSDRVVLVRGSNGRDDMNALIVGRAGNIMQSFHVGGAAEVLAGERWIVTTYSDQEVFGDDPICKQGLAFFDSATGFQSTYGDLLGKAKVQIWDCYCACWAGDDELMFFPYAEPNFPLVRLNLRDMTRQVWSTPEELHGSNALTSAGNIVYFYSPYDIPSRPTGRGNKVFRLEIGANRFEPVGQYDEAPGEYRKHPSIRGLPGGRFIAPKPDGYTILSFD